MSSMWMSHQPVPPDENKYETYFNPSNVDEWSVDPSVQVHAVKSQPSTGDHTGLTEDSYVVKYPKQLTTPHAQFVAHKEGAGPKIDYVWKESGKGLEGLGVALDEGDITLDELIGRRKPVHAYIALYNAIDARLHEIFGDAEFKTMDIETHMFTVPIIDGARDVWVWFETKDATHVKDVRLARWANGGEDASVARQNILRSKGNLIADIITAFGQTDVMYFPHAFPKLCAEWTTFLDEKTFDGVPRTQYG